MTLIVETGQGLPNANSFVTVVEADEWLAALGETVWTDLSQQDKERHLIIGAFYVSNGQIYYFSGAKQIVGQSLAWPRSGAVYRNGGPAIPESLIPTEVKLANIVAAQASARGILPGQPSDGSDSGGADEREVKSEKVGDLSVEYFDPLRKVSSKSGVPIGAEALATLGLPAVTGLLAPLLNEQYYMAETGDGRYKPPIVGPRMAMPVPPQFWIGFQDSVSSFLVTPGNVAHVRDVLLLSRQHGYGLGQTRYYGPH